MPLKISDEVSISQLSGPVSIKILTPIPEYLSQYSQAPVFILFGDGHCSNKNLCENSSPDNQVYRPEFLKLFCDILTQDEKIDFYIEGGSIHFNKIIKPTEGEPMVLLWNLFTQCIKNKEKPPLERIPMLEKINKIRWQSGDIRMWNSYPDQIKKILDQQPKQYNMYNFLKRINIPQTIKPEERQQYFTFTFKSQINAIKEMKFSFDKKVPMTADELYQEYVENPTSLINYQLSEINDINRALIKIKFKDYINYILAKQLSKIPEVPPQSLLLILMEIRDDLYKICNEPDINKIDNERFKNLYSRYNEISVFQNFVLHTECLLPDLYTFARSFKRMINNPGDGYSMINICYFGDLHTTNMAYFLENILKGYKSQMYVPMSIKPDTKDVNRCLDLSSIDNIPLRNLLLLPRTKRLRPKPKPT
jgi:hypothetical protein